MRASEALTDELERRVEDLVRRCQEAVNTIPKKNVGVRIKPILRDALRKAVEKECGKVPCPECGGEGTEPNNGTMDPCQTGPCLTCSGTGTISERLDEVLALGTDNRALVAWAIAREKERNARKKP